MRTLIADRGAGEPISLGAALIAGKKVAPDTTSLLAEDHRTALGWFRWHAHAADAETKSALRRRLCAVLKAHMRAEEEILYPRLRELRGQKARAQRAIEEHGRAKALIARLESSAGANGDADSLMRDLQAEIEAHVAEEEGELFPAARNSSLDLHEIGGALAARRAECLFELLGAAPPLDHRLKELPKMTVSQDEARKFFILGLKNAHAAARQGRTMADAQVGRLENYPQLKARLQAHLGEKDLQLKRLEEILHDLGESPSSLKEAAMGFMASASSMAAAAADDEVIKNGFAMLAHAKFEAAAYETLLVFGEAAGLFQHLRPIQQCLSEARGLASFLEENLRPTGVRFLQLRSEGAQASR